MDNIQIESIYKSDVANYLQESGYTAIKSKQKKEEDFKELVINNLKATTEQAQQAKIDSEEAMKESKESSRLARKANSIAIANAIITVIAVILAWVLGRFFK